MNNTKSDRAILLERTPPSDRSEVAARYDHQIEADTATLADYIDHAKRDLILSRRAEAMIRGHEDGRINIRFDQLMARVNGGMLPAHIEATISTIIAEMPPLNDAGIQAHAQQLLNARLSYLRKRYGVRPSANRHLAGVDQ